MTLMIKILMIPFKSSFDSFFSCLCKYTTRANERNAVYSSEDVTEKYLALKEENSFFEKNFLKTLHIESFILKQLTQ